MTLWPDDALPGQLPLFNREDLLAEYLADRQTRLMSNPPAAEPIWEPDEWFGKHPQMDFVPANSACL